MRGSGGQSGLTRSLRRGTRYTQSGKRPLDKSAKEESEVVTHLTFRGSFPAPAVGRRGLVRVVRTAVILVVALRVLASITTLASTMVLDGERHPRVVSVVHGSMEWLAGVRAGDSYVRWQAGDGSEVVTASGDVGIPSSWPPRPIEGAIVSASLLLTALALTTIVPLMAAV